MTRRKESEVRVRKLWDAADELAAALDSLRFGAPVTHVYNPLAYARESYRRYVEAYASTPKRVLFFGMNPGPFGMAQTGVPFGEVASVRDWLGIAAPVGRPPHEHPRRPVTGFACPRSEVSGARFWGLWREQYRSPERFFHWAFVDNYCPLVFMDEGGKNITPDKLRASEREALFAPCDQHLRAVVEALRPAFVVGIGKFAEGRARVALAGHIGTLHIASIPHPSPASPAANRDWGGQVLRSLKAQGVPQDDQSP